MFDKNSPSFIYGIGNVGRQDDGLGWAFIDALKSSLPEDVETFYNYQLNIEDAEMISAYSSVLFVDATKSKDVESYRLRKLEPFASSSFTSHYLSMESVLALCQNIYNKTPEAYVMEIRGYEWELQQGLTARAQQNLDHALSFFKSKLAE